jgi:hypothetical protein
MKHTENIPRRGDSGGDGDIVVSDKPQESNSEGKR